MQVEFSRPFNLSKPESVPSSHTFTATEEEKEGLSSRFGIQIFSLSSTVDLRQAPDNCSTLIQGTISGQVLLTCGVSLMPYTAEIEASFQILLSPEGNSNVLISEDEDQEFYADPLVDVGELIAQYFYLNLPPYPRHPEANFDSPNEGPKINNPFEVLKKILDEEAEIKKP